MGTMIVISILRSLNRNHFVEKCYRRWLVFMNIMYFAISSLPVLFSNCKVTSNNMSLCGLFGYVACN